MNPIENLLKLGLQLPDASTPGGNYESVNIRGSIAYIAIQFPIKNGEYLFQGRLGEDVSTEAGHQAMELCALNVLAQINKIIGFDKVEGLNHIDIFFQSGENWDESPYISNGASDLFLKVLEDRGKHARAILGVEKLPRNFCAGLTASLTIKNL